MDADPGVGSAVYASSLTAATRGGSIALQDPTQITGEMYFAYTTHTGYGSFVAGAGGVCALVTRPAGSAPASGGGPSALLSGGGATALSGGGFTCIGC